MSFFYFEVLILQASVRLDLSFVLELENIFSMIVPQFGNIVMVFACFFFMLIACVAFPKLLIQLMRYGTFLAIFFVFNH